MAISTLDPFVIGTTYESSTGFTSAQNGLTFIIDPHETGGSTGEGQYYGYSTNAEHYDSDSSGYIESAEYLSDPQEYMANSTWVAPVSGTGFGEQFSYVNYIDGFDNSTITFTDGSTLNVYVATRTMADGSTFLDFPDGAEMDLIQSHMNANRTQIASVKLGTHDGTVWERLVPAEFDQPLVKPPICFTAGTLIRTDKGAVPVETLQTRDKVWTLDDGFQPLVWVGSRKLSPQVLTDNPNWHPIRIAARTLSPCQESHILVSPQHRFLIDSIIAERMFGERQVMIPAKGLLDCDGVSVERHDEGIEYFHLLFRRHCIIEANGILAESMFMGEQAMNSLDAEAVAEIEMMMPTATAEGLQMLPARKLIKPAKAASLVQRHIKNDRDLVDGTPAPSDRSDSDGSNHATAIRH